MRRRPKTEIIIDGNNMAFRSAAVIKLVNDYGTDVSVPFGCLRSVRYTLVKYKPNSLIICWDGGRSPVRMNILKTYKHRLEKSHIKKHEIFDRKVVLEMMEVTQEMFKYLGIPQYRYLNIEADDVITDIALRSRYERVIIVSSDKDYFQLINRNIKVYNPITDTLWDEENLPYYKDYGFNPNEYLEFHILIGDKGDNIPGIKGLGKKTALYIIRKYKTVFNAIAKISVNGGKGREMLLMNEENRNILTRNRALIDLKAFNKTNPICGVNILESNPISRFKSFNGIVRDRKYNFNSIVKNFDYWIMPFMKVAVERGMK